MTTHFTEDAVLTGGDGGLFQIESWRVNSPPLGASPFRTHGPQYTAPWGGEIYFKGVKYLPTDSATAAGVLLFGLRPRGVKFLCSQDPELFWQKTITAGHFLDWHSNPHLSPAGWKPMPAKMLRDWVGAAVALAPDDAAATEARRLIIENLRPHAFESGAAK